MKLAPTEEQQNCIDAYTRGQILKVNALAGTGKTSVLEMMADARRVKTLYVAYNRAIVEEAKQRFPRHVACKTAHQIAFRAVGYQYADRLEGGNGGRLTPYRVAKAMGVTPIGGLSSRVVATLMVMSLTNWFNSVDPHILEGHVPVNILKRHGAPLNWSPTDYESAALGIMQKTTALWECVMAGKHGLPMPHDGYAKLFSLNPPQLPYDSILVDESQDLNPTLLRVLDVQHTQKTLVGDSFQQLYAWRGAIDSLSKVKADTTCYLTESFRFGSNIANAGNAVLQLLSSPVMVKGRGPGGVDSGKPAILCRTNGSLISELMTRALEQEKRVYVVGGTEAPRKLVEGLQDLMVGRPSHHPDLIGFRSYAEFTEAAEDDGAPPDMKMLARLLSQFPPGQLLQALEAAEFTRAEDAEVTVSTAHKAKGLEWDHVALSDDFMEPMDEKFTLEEANVTYVAVTRARRQLYGCKHLLKQYLATGRAKAAAEGSRQPMNKTTGS